MESGSGSLQSWLQRFDDAIKECETLGATLTDEMQRTYLMQNINEKIFEQTLLLWRGVLTRSTFPQTYDALKAYITNEYSSQMTQTDRAKVFMESSVHTKRRKQNCQCWQTKMQRKTKINVISVTAKVISGRNVGTTMPTKCSSRTLGGERCEDRAAEFFHFYIFI